MKLERRGEGCNAEDGGEEEREREREGGVIDAAREAASAKERKLASMAVCSERSVQGDFERGE